MIVATFAEVSSRFDATGGPYLYSPQRSDGFAAFEVGWMQWFSRVASWASVINVFVASLGFYWPAVTVGNARALLLTCLIAALALVNIVGIRQSAWTVNALTIGKLVPLGIVIIAGLAFARADAVVPAGALPLHEVTTAALLHDFRLRRLRRLTGARRRGPRSEAAVPFALIARTIVVVTVP